MKSAREEKVDEINSVESLHLNFDGHRSLDRDDHTSFYNMTKFLLCSTILFRGIRPRQPVDDVIRLKKGTKSKELSSII